jgi:serine/threonine protein kinase
MAPEIFESKPYTIKADVYSFGVIINRKLIKKIVLWEICSRETPYKSFSTPHAIMKFVTFDKGRPDLNSIQDGCPITLRDLIIRCWDHEPSARPAF